MTAGKIEVENLEDILAALNLTIATNEGAKSWVRGTQRFRMLNLRDALITELEEQKKHTEWKDLVAYWQDGTVCEVKFDGFRINKAGKIEQKNGETWGSYMGGYFASSVNPDWYTQDLRFKEHAWEFRIWFDRKDPSGWPLVEVA